MIIFLDYFVLLPFTAYNILMLSLNSVLEEKNGQNFAMMCLDSAFGLMCEQFLCFCFCSFLLIFNCIQSRKILFLFSLQ
jgi:Na+/alanine symporter